MGNPGITTAIEAFMQAIEKARDLAERGDPGAELDELLRHARELLDVVDEELLQLDHKERRSVFRVTPTLRAKLEALRTGVRGGRLH